MIDTAGYSTLHFELLDDDTILRITIDRPDSAVNAVDEALHHDLTRVFGALRTERELRAVVLTGSGGAFSAGGDFDWFPTLRTPERLAALRVDAKTMIWDLLDIEVPIVAAIGGPAIGLGASIALLCDVIVAAEGVRIADPHVKVGLVAGDVEAPSGALREGVEEDVEVLDRGDPGGRHEAQRLRVGDRRDVVAPEVAGGEGDDDLGGRHAGEDTAGVPLLDGRGVPDAGCAPGETGLHEHPVGELLEVPEGELLLDHAVEAAVGGRTRRGSAGCGSGGPGSGRGGSTTPR